MMIFYLCKEAGFIEWDESKNDYKEDNAGNIKIDIPITYCINGSIPFKVNYYLEDIDGGYTLTDSANYSIENSIIVNLNTFEGAVKEYDGFEITKSSQENAKESIIEIDGSGEISLYYDRNTYYIYYKVHGGIEKAPTEYKYGETIQELTPLTRSGYHFNGWTYTDSNGNPLANNILPSRMPTYSIIAEANWLEDVTHVTITYLVKDNESDKYHFIGSSVVESLSGSKISGTDDIEINLKSCGKMAHTHSESCYIGCDEGTQEPHTHTIDCYATSGYYDASIQVGTTATVFNNLKNKVGTAQEGYIYKYAYRRGSTTTYYNFFYINSTWYYLGTGTNYCNISLSGTLSNPSRNNYNSVKATECPIGEGHVHSDTCLSCGYESHTHTNDCGVDTSMYTFVKADQDVIVKGDGSTVINVYYEYKTYTLRFYYARSKTESGSTKYYVVGGTTYPFGAYAGYDNNADTPVSTLLSNVSQWGQVEKLPTVSDEYKNRYQEKEITYDDGYTYYYLEFSSPYNSYIGDLWPVGIFDRVATVGTHSSHTCDGYAYFSAWQGEYKVKYTQDHSLLTGSNHDGNMTVKGSYQYLGDDIIYDSQFSNYDTPISYLAFWENGADISWSLASLFRYQLWIEAADGIGDGSGYELYKTFDVYDDSDANDRMQTVTNIKGFNCDGDENSVVYTEFDAEEYDLTEEYLVNFYYTRESYELSFFNYNNASEKPESKILKFDTSLVNYNPGEPEYPEDLEEGIYEFAGWYTTSECIEGTEVDWYNDKMPEAPLTLYAKWIISDVEITLNVPNGKLNENTLENFRNEGFSIIESETDTGYTYEILGIPGGYPANEFADLIEMPVNDYGLTFNHWNYVNENGKTQIYLFDESQTIRSGMVLTTIWADNDYYGGYTVRYLSESPINNNTSNQVIIDGKTYYPLKDEKVITGVLIGKNVTEEAVVIDGYLVNDRSITKTVASLNQNGQPTTYYDFIYDKIEGSITYNVHYVLGGSNVDYGNSNPPNEAIFLAESKTITLDAEYLYRTTEIIESAQVISGYSPRDGWQNNLLLSADINNNNLYFYYLKNTDNEKYTIKYYFADENGNYSLDEKWFSLIELNNASIGQYIYNDEFLNNYFNYLDDEKQTLMVDRENDTTLSDEFIIIKDDGIIENVLSIFLKLKLYFANYDLNRENATWDDADEFLVKDKDEKYYQKFNITNPIKIPSTIPQSLTHTFACWNTEKDGSGTSYTNDNLDYLLNDTLKEDVSLYAQWTPKLKVTFDTLGGQWTDEDTSYLNEENIWFKYLEHNTITEPTNPTYSNNGITYKFIGWSTTNPEDTSDLKDEYGKVNIDVFNNKYKFDFSNDINSDTYLYAIWDIELSKIHINKTDETGKCLSGAKFKIERLDSLIVTNNHNYLNRNGSGTYVVDETFTPIEKITDDGGKLTFDNLTMGYYRITEIESPVGYMLDNTPIIVYLSNDQQPEVLNKSNNVSYNIKDGILTIDMINVLVYNCSISTSDNLTFIYNEGKTIWDPMKLWYEKLNGNWNLDENSGIKITNTSIAETPLRVKINFRINDEYENLIDYIDIVSNVNKGELSKTDSIITFETTIEKSETLDFYITLSEINGFDLSETPIGEVGNIEVQVLRPTT